MAAYAALRSLFTTLNNIQMHPRVSTFFDNKHIQSLHQIINFLLNFIESRDSRGGNREEEDEVLERQISSTTHEVEDVIESHVVNEILPLVPLVDKDARFARSFCARPTRSTTALFLDLETQIQDMISLKKMVMKFQGSINYKDDLFSSAPSSKPLTTTNKHFVVGFDEKVIQIMERLTGHQPGLQIVPIVGMGGIGKTTLAKCVYDNLYIVESFDIRAWVTVSQEYSLKNLLSQLLSCIKDTKLNKSIGAVHFETDLESEDHELGLKLYQTLWGRRYLIVLDDMWSVEAWDRIQIFFPNSGDRSRVVITTRIWSVATPLSSSSFEMDFLDEDQSWKLFCGNVFLEKGCPPEIEKIGKKIVRECKGLPLTIVVIGGLLRNSRSTREYWKNFARDLNSILISGNYGHCLNILSLSYNHLPAHLKPCFLYMGVFREDEKIRVSTLIELLVAEGFLKPNEGLTMEEVATDYLNDLVDRNLIFADSWKWNGRIEYCKMHDLVREVCLKISEKEQIFQRMSEHEIPAGINGVRRIVFRGTHIPSECSSASLARTFLSDSELEGALPLEFRLLRVLSVARNDSPEVIFQHVNLRTLVCSSKIENPKLPSSLSLLWNMHTLIFTEYEQVEVPSEIWYMRQLRHLQSDTRLYLPDPPPREEENEALLPNLQTLSKVVDFSFSEQVCKRIPNIKKLGIVYTEECEKKCLFNLDHLRKLQSLYCKFEVPKRDEFLESLRLPSSLRKLSLNGCGVDWEDVNRFGLCLPHLQVLKLYNDAVVGGEWDCVEGAFPRLKVLKIMYIDLIKWSAESLDCFPVLEKLLLFGLDKLERIPSEIQTLGSLRVQWCSVSATVSSVEILEEQLSLENDHLQLLLEFRNMEEQEKFMEMVDINNFSTKNFNFI